MCGRDNERGYALLEPEQRGDPGRDEEVTAHAEIGRHVEQVAAAVRR